MFLVWYVYMVLVDLGLIISSMTSSRNKVIATFGLNISETKPDSGMVPMDSLKESAHGLSFGHLPMTSCDPMTS